MVLYDSISLIRDSPSNPARGSSFCGPREPYVYDLSKNTELVSSTLEFEYDYTTGMFSV
jgi:hypothetical protein